MSRLKTKVNKSAVEKGLIGQRRINFSYTTRGGVRQLNCVTLLLPNENLENWVYIKKEKDGFIVSKEAVKDAIPREVKRGNGQGKQCRINFRNIADEEKMYDVFQTKEGYQLKESQNQTVPKRNCRNRDESKGLVIDSSNIVSFPQKYVQLICANMERDIRVIVTEYYHPYRYITLEFIQAKDLTEKQKINEITSKSPLTRKTDKEKMSRTLKISRSCSAFAISRFYMEASKLQSGDKLFINSIEGNVVTLTNSEKICNICGKPIKEYKEKIYSMNACTTCGTSAKVLKKQMAKYHDLSVVKQNLLDCQKMLSKIVNESEDK